VVPGCVDTIEVDVAITGGELPGVSMIGVGENVSAVVGSELILSNLTLLRTIGAVILQTGKSPGLRLQLTLVTIIADSTSCRLGF